MATPQKLPSKSLLLPGIAPHLFSSQRRRPRRRPVLNSSAHTKIGSNDSGASIIRSTSSHSSSGSSRTTESIHPSSDESAGTGNRRILEARVAEAERRAADAERRAADAEARAADAEHLANAEARLVHCRARVAAAQGELEELKGQEGPTPPAVGAQDADPPFGVHIEQEPYSRGISKQQPQNRARAAQPLFRAPLPPDELDPQLGAVVLYFRPFASIKLERMSGAFGRSVEDVEDQVVALIQSGSIHGRILYAKQTDYRAELFARAIEAGRDIQSTNRKVLLRMRLYAELPIKAPKGYNASIADLLPIEALAPARHRSPPLFLYAAETPPAQTTVPPLNLLRSSRLRVDGARLDDLKTATGTLARLVLEARLADAEALVLRLQMLVGEIRQELMEGSDAIEARVAHDLYLEELHIAEARVTTLRQELEGAGR
ncbi:hypothetical protein B0H17DRAFT_1326592 [Mycena rosella]|uniref:PCI domain-containing protein n=1 Tax=Mycena rosella TaxID=1033263 RepID=A0AAD7M7C0_MYCRO|nr:hypothetical protein B0H17DRAFT_1326592 [Mycena rosella]